MLKRNLHWLVLFLLIIATPLSIAGNTGTIKKVLSGDLIQIGDSFIARFTGLFSPPRNTKMGYKIYDFTKRELEGKVVKLFTWTTNNTAAGIVRNEENQAFVQVHYGEGLAISFNELLLKKGYARVDKAHLPQELAYYLELEEEACSKKLGIWAEGK